MFMFMYMYIFMFIFIFFRMKDQIESSLYSQRTKISAEDKDSFSCRKSSPFNKETRKEKSLSVFFSSCSRLSLLGLLCIFLLVI